MTDLVSVRSRALNSRRSLLLAAALSAAGAIILYFLAKTLLIHPDFLGSIYENGIPRALAGFFLAAFPYIHQRLAGKRRLSFSDLPDEAVPFEAYTLPWYILLSYGVIIAFAIAGISLFLVWLVGMATAFFVTRAISILNLIMLLIAFYHLGSWVGIRSAVRPLPTLVGIVLGYVILEILVVTALNIDSSLRSPSGLVIFLGLSLVAGLTGTRIGRRRRLSSYSQFILGFVPEPDRQALIDVLYREVKQRISRAEEIPDEQDGRV